MAKWQLPTTAQTTPRLCWEACGRMMWGWRWINDPGKLASYRSRAGAFLDLDEGLNDVQMMRFFSALGLRALRPAHGYNVRFALAWTPVIITQVGSGRGHAIIASGHANGAYSILNPAGRQTIDFGTGIDTQSVTETLQPQGDIDRALGKVIWYF